MCKYLIKIMLFVLVLFIENSYSQTTDLSKLSWLHGSWKKFDNKTNKINIEKWDKLLDNELRGIGCTLKGKDTVFVEKLKIITKDNLLYYVADVKENKEPALFKFSSIVKNGFVCENPEHDFPKRIEYKLMNKHLTVTISDDKKKVNFEFEKQ